jgi:hypothetical protein
MPNDYETALIELLAASERLVCTIKATPSPTPQQQGLLYYLEYTFPRIIANSDLQSR